MPARPLLSLPPDARLVREASGGLAIEHGRLRLPLEEIGPGIHAALETMARGGATEEDLTAQVREADGARLFLRFHQLLADLARRRLLCRGVGRSGEPVVTVVPFSPGAPEPRENAPAGAFILSRFACARRERRSLLVESPLAHSYLILHGEPGALLLSRLAAAADRDALSRAAGFSGEEADLCIELLWEAGFLSSVEPDGEVREERDPELLQWEPHDLLFHARSRAGRHGHPYGGTYPFLGIVEPLPALKPKRGGAETLDLFRPDIQRLMREDPPFTRVVEERRSRRSRGEQPVTVRELGELLFRSSRLRQVVATATHEVSERVYPGGGAVYELEIYPVVQWCEGLSPGLYHYVPGEHQLERLTGMTPEARALLETAVQTANAASSPEILIVLTARFQRVTWKYRSMAYAGILKNVGVLYQTIYLVATAMGIAVCALGGGDSDLFARAAGLRLPVEASVGELILSRGPA